jgi:hypothetical protein
VLCVDVSCTSSLKRFVSRAEYILARKADVWYFTALVIATIVNLILFFAATVDGRSSVWCDVQHEGAAPDPDVQCKAFPVFHWVTQVCLE